MLAFRWLACDSNLSWRRSVPGLSAALQGDARAIRMRSRPVSPLALRNNYVLSTELAALRLFAGCGLRVAILLAGLVLGRLRGRLAAVHGAAVELRLAARRRGALGLHRVLVSVVAARDEEGEHHEAAEGAEAALVFSHGRHHARR